MLRRNALDFHVCRLIIGAASIGIRVAKLSLYSGQVVNAYEDRIVLLGGSAFEREPYGFSHTDLWD